MRPAPWRLLAVCCWLGSTAAPGAAPRFTASPIAWANLDAQIERAGDSEAADSGWLLRLRLRADPAALERTARLAAQPAHDAAGYLRRARHLAVLHAFDAALRDLDHAARAGGDLAAIEAARRMVRVADGHAADVLAVLRARARSHPGAASATALAHACVAVGLPRLADRWYRRALATLDTVSPFAWAELQFARGMLWGEHLGNARRGAAHYRAALAALPEFVGARIHLAEIERAQHAPARALQLIDSIVEDGDDPEALALRAELRTALKLPGAATDYHAALQRFADLTTRFPLAYADHAARFYLGPGHDPQRAWALAQLNLANRPTAVAIALANHAAQVAGADPAIDAPLHPTPADRAACTR